MAYYRFKRFFLGLIILFVLFSFCSPVYATTTVVDIEQEIINEEKQWQNDFIITCLYPFLENTQAWTNTLKPIFDNIHEYNYDVYIWRGNSNLATGEVAFGIRTYYSQVFTNTTTFAYTSKFDNSVYSLPARTLNGTTRIVTYYVADNSFSDTIQQNAFTIADVIRTYKTDLWYDFMNLIYGTNGGNDYTSILQDIVDYLDDINYSTAYVPAISANVQNIYNWMQAHTQDYSTILGQINNRLNNIYQSVGNIEDTAARVENYLNNSNVVSNTIVDNIPANIGITSPTDTIVDTFFNGFRDVFTSEETVDIVIPFPYNNQSITVPSDYTETHAPLWFKVILRAFYWFFVSRWILMNLISLVDNLRNLSFMENHDNGSPKTELL